MTIAINASPTIPAKNKLYNLIREPAFYQEAYVASYSYIGAIGNRLKKDWGFRLVTDDDVAKYHPFLSPGSETSLLLNLISDSNTTVPSHVIQLPKDLSSLEFSAKRDLTRRSSTNLSTILTSSHMYITETTHSIPPLRDLLSFLQCLLPSSEALFLSLPSSSPHSFGRCLGTSSDDSPLMASEEAEEEEEEEKLAIVNRWRQGVENGISPTRIPTPSTEWLDQNEDMLRDTVGCGYYRRLREVAEDQKDSSECHVVVKVEDASS